MTEALGEFPRQIAENGNHDIWMLLGELVKFFDSQSVADDPFVGDDVGGASAAVEKCHFSESQTRSDGRDPLVTPTFAMKFNLDADSAAREDEEELRGIASAHDDVALLEHEWADDTFDQLALPGCQAVEKIDLVKRELRSGG